MKRKRILKKALTLGLCVATFASAITGCGKSNSGEESLVNQATKNSKDYVFRKEIIDLGGDYDCNGISIKGDRVYSTSYTDESTCLVFSMDSDGGNLKTVKLPQKDNESYSYVTPDGKGNFYTVYNIYDYSYMEDEEPVTYTDSEGTADADAAGEADTAAEGGAEADAAASETSNADDADAKKVAGSDENASPDTDPQEPQEEGAEGNNITETTGDQKFLLKIDESGNEIFRKDILEDHRGEEEEFYIYSMVYDDNYGLIMSSNVGIQAFNDDTLTFKTLLDTRDPSSSYRDIALSLTQGFEGRIFVNFWGDKGLEVHTFDPATGKMSERIESFSGYSDSAFFGGNGYDLYISTSEGFFGYDLAKDTKTKLLDYADSDIGLNYSTSSAVAISDNEFVANIPDEEYKYRLTRLVKVPADQVKDRTVITLAGNYIDYNIRRKVYKFNDENQDYKIKLVDYSTLSNGDDFNAGATQFNLDLVSGNVPDIMFFTTDSPVESYINKGLFIDLTTYIKNDPELKDVEFVDNILDAFKTGDKMYQLIPSFYITSIAAKTSNLKGKEYLTLKECSDIIEGMGVTYDNAFGLITREEMLNNGLVAGGSDYINWETKSCSFNGDEFIDFLEFVNKFPESLPENAWDDYSEENYRTNKSIFSIAYLNGFRNYRRYVDGTFGGEVSLIGFPSELGSNRSVIVPNCRLCISSKSKYADVCWQLIREFYLEEYQDSLEYEFPVRKSSYDKMAEKSKEKQYWIDEDGVKHEEDDTYYIGDQEVKVQPLTQSDVDYVKKFIGSLTNAYNANTNVYNIITEEVAPFFAGQKTAKEVADIIQSRVSIYVNENS